MRTDKILEVKASQLVYWRFTPTGQIIKRIYFLVESTRVEFNGHANRRVIDSITTLMADIEHLVRLKSW